MKISKILEATKGTLVSGDKDFDVTGFSQDSRQVSTGMMYIPLVGERFDGHDFIESAIDNGASAIITSRDDKYENINVIKVEDTLKALQDMAHYLRHDGNYKVIGVTGSVGKTSTRDMIYSVVKEGYKTLKTEGNYNNHIGLPLTILRSSDEEVLVLEMGMNHLKEMEELSKIANPDIAVITNVGTAHIGEVGSRENILKAKMEVIEGMNGGTLIINNDNDMLSTVSVDNLELVKVGIDSDSDFKAKNVELYDNGSKFDFDYQGTTYTVNVPVAGKHFVMNALIALSVGIKLDISIDKCIKGINNFVLTKNRMDIIELKNNITLIDGTYNASEDSMKSSIDVLSNYKKTKIAVLADMLELGDYSKQLHENVGAYLASKGIDCLVTVGSESQYIASKAKDEGMSNVYCCNDNSEVINYLLNLVKKDTVILLKGSNGMRLKEVVNELKEKL